MNFLEAVKAEPGVIMKNSEGTLFRMEDGIMFYRSNVMDNWLRVVVTFSIIHKKFELVEEKKTLSDKLLGWGKLLKDMNPEDFNLFGSKAINCATGIVYREEDVKEAIMAIMV